MMIISSPLQTTHRSTGVMVLLKGTNAGPANGTSQKAAMERTQSTVFLCVFFGIISSDSARRIKFVETGYALDCRDTSHDVSSIPCVSFEKENLTGNIVVPPFLPGSKRRGFSLSFPHRIRSSNTFVQVEAAKNQRFVFQLVEKL